MSVVKIFSTSQSHKIQQICRSAALAELYQCDSWMQKRYYNAPELIRCIVWAIDPNNDMIGCAILLHQAYWDNGPVISCYILPEYRRQGIGTSLIRKMFDDHPTSNRFYAKGIEGSVQFYEQIFAHNVDNNNNYSNQCVRME